MAAVGMKLPGISTIARAARSGKLWNVVPHYWHKWGRAAAIDRTPPVLGVPYGTPGALEVCMMTGEIQHYDLLLTAKSFMKYYPGPVSLVVHCNETVTDDAIARMNRHLPNAKIWPRRARDAVVVPYLQKKGYERCIRLRDCYVFSTRLIDAFVLSDADRIMFLDSDIFSYRPLIRLHELASRSEPINVFGKDPAAETYGMSRDQMHELFGITDINLHLNGGFCLVHRSVVDHQLLNDWLGVPDFPWNNYFLEQTFLVLLMAKDWGRNPNVVVLPPDEYNMGRTIENAEDTCDLVHYCGHYLSKTRIAMQSIGQPRLIRDLSK